MKSFRSEIPDLNIYIEEKDIVIISEKNLECLSNAAINGSRVKSNSIVNHHVSLKFNHTNLEDVLNQVKKRFNLSKTVIGLLTAVEMADAILINEKVDNIDFTIILTVGLTNTSGPKIDISDVLEEGDTSPYEPGPINIILLINCKLTEHAIVNLFITITEAKTLLLNKHNVRTKDGSLATGTSTDTILVGFTDVGKLVEWSGYATKFGQSIGQNVFKALSKALTGKVNNKKWE
ncbi:MAG: adenosylcobinamide amidohydrolase [Promethearchaeota archaeon]